jgi:hypothetical protein
LLAISESGDPASSRGWQRASLHLAQLNYP